MDEVLSILISAFDALTWELSLALGVAFFASFTTAYAGFGVSGVAAAGVGDVYELTIRI